MNPAEFENIARAEESLWWYRGQREILFSLLDQCPRFRQLHKVLEAGCGTGFNAEVLRNRYKCGIVPLDLHQTALEHAQRRNLVQVVQGDIATLPFASDTFDGVVSLDVIVHFPPQAEKRSLLEFARVLRPQGVLVLRVAAFDSLRSRHSAFVQERQRFSRSRLVAAVQDAGFRVLRATYAQALLFPVAWLKFRVWEPLSRAAPQSGLQPVAGWLNELLFSSLKAEAKWLGSGRDLPFGQSILMIAERNT